MKINSVLRQLLQVFTIIAFGTAGLIAGKGSHTNDLAAMARGSNMVYTLSDDLRLSGSDPRDIQFYSAAGTNENARIRYDETGSTTGHLEFFSATSGTLKRTMDLVAGTDWAGALFGSVAHANMTPRAPVTIEVDPADAPSSVDGRAADLWFGFYADGSSICDTAANPPGGFYVGIYGCMENTASRKDIWAFNPVVTKTASNPGTIVGIEVDTQNAYSSDGSAPPFPWTTASSNGSLVGVGSVLNGAGYSGSAAFSGTVNGALTGTWVYGMHLAGVSRHMIYLGGRTEHPNGVDTNVGNVNAVTGIFDDTDSTTFIKTVGTHTTTIDAPGFSVSGAGNTVISSAVDGALVLQYTGGNSANTAAAFYRGSTPLGSITTSAGGTSYNTLSDRRAKQNIHDYSDGLDAVRRLRPVQFQYRQSPTVDVVGFLADEAMQVVPYAVTGAPDGAEFQQMDVTKLVPFLVSSVQALDERIKQLEVHRERD